MLIEHAQVGPYTMKLVEKLSGIDSEFFEPRYYFLCSHEDGPWITAMAFLGQNRDHAVRQFERRRDNQIAYVEAQRAGCA